MLPAEEPFSDGIEVFTRRVVAEEGNLGVHGEDGKLIASAPSERSEPMPNVSRTRGMVGEDMDGKDLSN